ncbi:DUF6153 domain-containing protein [Nocardia ninae]|uniref:Uncharacterized protein n=1 Tax=Nocardia ninae NBRC 108245 TaxID=1210091 RepID=A0A511MG56_9NOCA|nr:DUF6153 family protein [Nocardia ninae]GEM39683.1 hypothetical protein NN4_42020 [Nocardia ninae NBRC 108245]
MVERHSALRVTGLARALGVLVLLAGIVIMHAVVFAMPSHAGAAGFDHDSRASESRTGQLPAVAMPAEPMATVVFADRHDAVDHGHDQATDLTAMPAVAQPVGASRTEHTAPDMDCADDGCGGTHGGMHGCVFILAAAALLFALVLLYRMALERPGNDVARLRHRRPRRERSPPWTVLTLAELSILRI